MEGPADTGGGADRYLDVDGGGEEESDIRERVAEADVAEVNERAAARELVVKKDVLEMLRSWEGAG